MPQETKTTTQNSTALINLTPAPQGNLVPEEEKFMVALLRAGVGVRKYFVSPGSTVKELMDAAGCDLAGQDITNAAGEKLSMESQLSPRELICVVPKPKNA